jgi:hypothetical protein
LRHARDRHPRTSIDENEQGRILDSSLEAHNIHPESPGGTHVRNRERDV